MKRFLDTLSTFALLLLFAHGTSLAQSESFVDVLTEGHWLEVRGFHQADGSFLAQRIDLVQPGRYEILVGTISGVQTGGNFTLLGQRVEVQRKTGFRNVNGNALEHKRVKVEGYYRSAEKFSARQIAGRGGGRDGITGRIDNLRSDRDGLEVGIMGYRVKIPGDVVVRHELNVTRYQTSEFRAQAIVERDLNEEDRFGKGIRISDTLLLGGQVQARGTSEHEFDLDAIGPDGRDDLEATFRGRIIYQPSSSFFAMAELYHRQLLRDDATGGRTSNAITKLAQTYLYWIDPFDVGLDLQVGRVNFNDKREWLYDHNLDALRAVWTGNNIRTEISYSETLSDGNIIDEAASNSIVYISNNDEDRHFAGYMIHRDFDLLIPAKRTNFGLRALGNWLPRQEVWAELAYMVGETGPIENQGSAFDIGSTWRVHERFALTVGYAVGQGDDQDPAVDSTFRQSGLQDNNAKFAGVTSFRYYGELMDPELANIEILTLGLGWLPGKGISLDVVGHTYQQNELSNLLVNSDIGKQPNGIDLDLGMEVDFIVGWRTDRQLDLEVIAAWFSPGDAFDNADDAFLGKLQFRYRF